MLESSAVIRPGILLVNRVPMWSILRGDPFVRIMGWFDVSHAAFLQRRDSYLIYK